MENLAYRGAFFYLLLIKIIHAGLFDFLLTIATDEWNCELPWMPRFFDYGVGIKFAADLLRWLLSSDFIPEELTILCMSQCNELISPSISVLDICRPPRMSQRTRNLTGTDSYYKRRSTSRALSPRAFSSSARGLSERNREMGLFNTSQVKGAQRDEEEDASQPELERKNQQTAVPSPSFRRAESSLLSYTETKTES